MNGPLPIALVVVMLMMAGVSVVVAVRARKRRDAALRELAEELAALAGERATRPILAYVGGETEKLIDTYNNVVPSINGRIARLEGDRQLLGTVLGGMAEGVVAVDARRRLLFANDAASRLFSLGPNPVGRLIVELIRSPLVHEAIEATLSGSRPHKVEIAISRVETRPLGPPLVLEVQGTPLPGTPGAGALLVFHDVTENRRLERVRQDFVANASHELKTPLASIKAYAETLIDGALDDPNVNRRFLQQIDEQADRLNMLVQDLLSLARLESGQDVFHHAPMVLSAALRTLFESQRGRAEAKGLEYELAIDPAADGAVVTADGEAIRQVLDNLIDNAIKYTPEPGRVRVSMRLQGATAVLEVADTGIGIPHDEQSRVFERFYRIDKARSRELGGTGLGLSIVKHIVNTLGGTITLQSRVGLGSTFTVRLPTSREGAS
jgi:two-component system phosphate regulon sensor histidine kinase PhoR